MSDSQPPDVSWATYMPVARRPHRVWLLLASCVTLLLALEIGVRIEAVLDGNVPRAMDESLEREWRWAEKHIAQGTAIISSRFSYDPFVGWRNRPHVRFDGLSTNSAGMRGSKEFSLERRTGLRRLVLVGDSYTFGEEARDEETFGHLLDTGGLAGGWEVLNMAVSGTGTDQQTIEFEYYGSCYRPDVVVLGFFVRDYNRNVLSFRDYAKPMFVVDAGVEPDGLRLTGSPVIAPEVLYSSYASGRRRIGGSLLRPRTPAAFSSLVRRMEEWSVGPGVTAWEVLSRLMARFQRPLIQTHSYEFQCQ